MQATVVTPPSFQGDALQGQVADAKASRGKSYVEITFTSLLHRGVSVPVAATVTSIANSQNQPGVDEAGRPFAATNSTPGNSQVRSRVGSRLGGMLGGAAGGAISDASSVPVAPGIPSIHIEARGPGMDLAAGSAIELAIRATGGQSLSGLPPNTAGGTPPDGPPMAPSTPPHTPAAAANAGAGAAPSATPAGQPELKSAKIDFISGEKTVFYDDFSDMAQDEPPPHWKVRDGTVDLLLGNGVRELHAKEGVKLTSPRFVVPANFTFELEFTGEGETSWHFMDKDGSEVAYAVARGEPTGEDLNTSVQVKGDALGSGGIKADNSKPMHFALWVQEGRVRAYLNGQRVVDVNQVEFPRVAFIQANVGGYRPNGIRSVRVAESTPDFSSVMNATGKYVTHGIHFDTDSDRLQPESGAVLKQVAAGLTKNPSLKLEIDGFTDAVGDQAHNLDLSKRRAQAVMSVLVSQFGVDAGRLTASGFGPDQPVASNDTAAGRAENRRVEFVKK